MAEISVELSIVTKDGRTGLQISGDDDEISKTIRGLMVLSPRMQWIIECAFREYEGLNDTEVDAILASVDKIDEGGIETFVGFEGN